MLDNGNFIFLWENDDIRKMVLTNNVGATIQKGKMTFKKSTWQDPTTWKKEYSKDLDFYITNFVGMNGKKYNNVIPIPHVELISNL